MLCALFFGSFNPLHYGHISIAKYLLDACNVDNVRFILSPQNPLKDPKDLEEAYLRLGRLQMEVEKMVSEAPYKDRLKVSSIEFNLPMPLYTINTLRYIRKSEPNNNHILIIGADNMAILEKWYQWEKLIQEFEIWVYPRAGANGEELCRKYSAMPLTKCIHFLSEAPLHNISSTQIRRNQI